MRSWFNHVQGATRLLELRGVEQLDSQIGSDLFTTVRLQNVCYWSYQNILLCSNVWFAGNQQRILEILEP